MNIHYETKHDQPSKEFLSLPFSPHLPKDKAGLLALRVRIRERCLEDEEFRKDIDHMCSLDVVFFAQMFIWFHETRGTEDQIGEFPALLDPDQMDILAWFQKHVGTIDMTVEKTRGVGLSYLACVFLLWLWLYNPNRIEMGILSKDEASLDKKDRPGSLMGKMDLAFKKLPAWMRLDKYGKTVLYRTASNQNHKFVHRTNGNIITGYVPTNDKLRSDRLYCLVADEARFLPIEDQKWLAAAYGTVNSVVWISTHQGAGNLFYRLTKDTESRMVRISTWWWENRRCRRGMYRVRNGLVEVLDEGYKFPDGYFEQPFIHRLEKYIRGRVRSPWTDRYFQRPGIDPYVLLEELYGLTAVEDRRLIHSSVFRILAKTVKNPLAVGDVVEGEWVDDIDGPIKFWRDPDSCAGSNIIGVDPNLSQTGGAYASGIGFDLRTGEQILAIRCQNMDPTRFPGKIVEVANFLSKGGGTRTKISFESTGIGTVFRTGLENLRYPSVCKDDNTKKSGFPNNDRGACWLLEFGRAIREGDITVRDEVISDELGRFERDDKMELIFTGTDGHGDSAQAGALAWWGGRKLRRAVMRAQKQAVKKELEEAERQPSLWSEQFA